MPRTASRNVGALTGLLLALAFAPEAAAGEPANPLGDLRPGLDDFLGRSGEFIAYRGDVVFGATDAQHGGELWLFDGGHVRLLEDVWPGPLPGLRSLPVELDGRLYFQGDDGVLGSELWVSDGTAAGTVPAADVCPGACDGLLSPPVVALGLLWFTGYDEALGAEPWVSDGTAAGTRPVADLCPGPCGSNHPIRSFREWQQRVYFEADDGESGRELWVSDGTPAGTGQVADLCPGSCTSSSDHLTPWAGHLYFAAATPDGEQVWRTDGAGAVEPVTDVEFGVRVRRLVPVADRLYVLGSRLLQTDGTVAGTRPASELLVYGPNTVVLDLQVAGARLVFSVDRGQEGELWALGPQGASAVRVSTGVDVAPWPLARFGDRVVFEGRTLGTGAEPWISDGTAEGTLLLVDAKPGPTGSRPGRFSEAGGRLWFGADGDPWTSDGTPAGTYRLDQMNDWNPHGLQSPIASTGDRACFLGIAVGGDALWCTDGTAAGTQQVLSWQRLERWGFRAAGDRLYFNGSPTFGPSDLYVSDGTAAGTERLADRSTQVTPALGAVYFSTSPDGQRLWTTDGTPEGTHQILDVNPGYTTACPIVCPPIPDFPRQLTEADGLLYFVAFEPGSPLQLWVSDGTEEGSRPIHNFPVGPGSFTAHAAGGVLFSASIEDGGNELWWSDGTEEGTAPVADLLEGPLSSNPRGFVRLGPTTLFVASDRSGGDQLWRADGAPPVASRVRAFTSRSARAQAGSLFVAGSKVYFPLFHPVHGQELWVSDGTRKGTRLLVDLRPGPGGSYPQPLAFAAGRLFFAADDGETGLELWATDGTAEGTALVQDLAPGPPPSSPNNAAMAGDLLVFFANDGIHGNEPWALDPATVGSPLGVPGVRVLTLAP